MSGPSVTDPSDVGAAASLGQRTAVGTLRVFASEALLLPTGLLTAAYLSRRLGAVGYGWLTLANTVLGWVEWTTVTLFSRAAVKLVSEARDWRPVGQAIARLYLLVGTAVGVGVWLTADVVATLLREPVLAGLLRLYALDAPLMALGRAHESMLTGLGDFDQRAWASASRWLSRLALVFLLGEMGLGVRGAILSTIGASVVGLAVARWRARPRLLGRVRTDWRPLWALAAPIFLYSLTMRLFEKLDVMMLRPLGASAADVGVYGAAQRLSVLPTLFAVSFAPVLLASVSRALSRGQQGQARSLSAGSLRLVVALLPLATLAAGASPQIVSWIYDPTFAAAGRVLAWLIVAAWAQVVIAVTTSLLVAADRPAWSFALVGPMLPLVVLGHLWLIPRAGAVGAAQATTAVSVLAAVACLAAAYRTWRMPWPLATAVRALLLAGPAFVLGGLQTASGPWVMLKVAGGCLAVALVFVLLGEVRRQEWRALAALLGRRGRDPAGERGRNG